MSRKIKFSDGEFYHLYNRGVDKREIFLYEYDYIRFQMLLYLCNSNIDLNMRDMFGAHETIKTIFATERNFTLVDIGAYCLMPNHFHLLVGQRTKNGISQFMQRLGTAYTMYFNKKNDRTGSLFQGPFKAKHASRDEYLKYLFAYIHLNPIKIIEPKWKEEGVSNLKKAEAFLEQFQFSSFQEYTGVNRPQNIIINKKSFPDYFPSQFDFNKLIGDWLKYKAAEEN